MGAMTFPLMQGHDHINLVARLDPAAALRDQELGERIRVYPKLLQTAPPEFHCALQTGTTWRVIMIGAMDPSGARYGLASVLRQGARELEQDPAMVDAMLAAADRLDPGEGEQLAKDEWEIGDRRYRVIRVESFMLIGDRTLEPPRCTDTEPARGTNPLNDHLIDPRAPAGQWETQLRLNLVGLMPPPGTVSPEVEVEARHAIYTHPGVVLLPPTFNIVEVEGTSWRPLTGGDGPAAARENLASYFTQLLPRLREFEGDPATTAELTAWEQAYEQIMAMPGPEFTALGRHFRTVRVSRFLRLGRDGPETPRPSDQELYGLPS